MTSHNLIVLSDIHLGSDLVHHARPDAPGCQASCSRRDRELVALLDWYRQNSREGRPWRLVIAGDFVDFAGMSVSAPGDPLSTELTAEELAHGVGNAVDHTLFKLRLVAAHHAAVFASLARFIAAGNSVVVVRGNHDMELHWEAVQEELRCSLALHAPIDQGSIEFVPWFYYEEGVVYVEHGHQYDSYCSYDHVLYPVLPSDPRRSSRSLSDVLLRYVVRPTRGMTESGHDKSTPLDYVRFAYRLGISGMVTLARRFLSAVAAMITIWRDHFSDAAEWVRKEHERKLRLLAEAKKISEERLTALLKLQRPPVTRSLTLILASLMLDRLVILALALIAVLAVWFSIESGGLALLAAAAAATTALVLGRLWTKRRECPDASAELRERAPLVAKLFPAAFVVMGHTHLPEVHAVPAAETTYVNLGAWAEDDAEEGFAPRLPATRTHLVLSYVDGIPVAELYQWKPSGPEQFSKGFAAAPQKLG